MEAAPSPSQVAPLVAVTTCFAIIVTLRVGALQNAITTYTPIYHLMRPSSSEPAVQSLGSYSLSPLGLHNPPNSSGSPNPPGLHAPPGLHGPLGHSRQPCCHDTLNIINTPGLRDPPGLLSRLTRPFRPQTVQTNTYLLRPPNGSKPAPNLFKFAQTLV